jgi:hypothetical protein
MYEQHWRYMQRIIELGDGPNVYARYNTNLSRISYRGVNLFSDILCRLRDWQICASLDGTGAVGEYIRTGLNYEEFLKNFEQGLQYGRRKYNVRQMRLDFTLTLPGMFELTHMEQLARDFNVDLLAKVIFSFGPQIAMSPLCLPRPLLDAWIDDLLAQCQTRVMRDMLAQLKTRPTFEEQWPDTYQAGITKGKKRILQLEKIRKDMYTMSDILAARPAVLEWWNQIDD